MEFTLLELVLSCVVLLAAGNSYLRGRDDGIGDGSSCTLDILVSEGIVSRYKTDEGEWDICSAGVMSNICPKCGFKDGEICG